MLAAKLALSCGGSPNRQHIEFGAPRVAEISDRFPENGFSNMNVGFRIPTAVNTELGGAFDLRQYLNFVWRNWVLIASVTALAFIMAVIYLMGATPLYTATTQVLLVQPRRSSRPGCHINDSRID